MIALEEAGIYILEQICTEIHRFLLGVDYVDDLFASFVC